jgi:molybdenum-dependent DNA-binding transcriptional regulator ModE
MKYPFHTESMPVVGQEAQMLLKAIESNGVITNAASQATVNRILARRQAHRSDDKKIKIRRN